MVPLLTNLSFACSGVRGSTAGKQQI